MVPAPGHKDQGRAKEEPGDAELGCSVIEGLHQHQGAEGEASPSTPASVCPAAPTDTAIPRQGSNNPPSSFGTHSTGTSSGRCVSGFRITHSQTFTSLNAAAVLSCCLTTTFLSQLPLVLLFTEFSAVATSDCTLLGFWWNVYPDDSWSLD